MNDRKMMTMSFAAAAGVAAVLFAGPAIAADECFRPAECTGDELCINTTCTAPDQPLDTCDGDGDCGGDHAVCDEGFCKTDAVYCENPAGHCYTDNMWGTCGCEAGIGSDWYAEEPPDPLLDDAALYEECLENLVSLCGEEAPDLNDECTEEQIEVCTAFYDHLNALLEACGEDAEEPSFAELASCCHHFDDADQQAAIECVMGLALAECADLDDCWDEGDPAGDDLDDGEGDDDATAESGDAGGSGCAVLAVPMGPDGLLALLAANLF